MKSEYFVQCKDCAMRIPSQANKCHYCQSSIVKVNSSEMKEANSATHPLNTILTNSMAAWRLIGLSFAIPLVFLIVLFCFIWFLVPNVKQSLGTGAIEITPEGAIKITGDKKTNAAFMLSPNGGDRSPWIDTGIKVKAGQKLQFVASGRINLAAHRMIDYAARDLPPPSAWVGPQGDDGSRLKTFREIDSYRNKFVLAPESPRGTIIGRIAPEHSSLPVNPMSYSTPGIGDFFEIWKNRSSYQVKTDGNIWLTVNEIWLSEDAKEAFLPTDPQDSHKFDRYYILWCEDSIIQDYAERMKASNKLTLDELKKKEEIIHRVRDSLFTGDKIEPTLIEQAAEIAREIKTNIWTDVILPSRDGKRVGYPNLYFDDNSGSFSVTVEITD